jgi:isochorismate hydrolase
MLRPVTLWTLDVTEATSLLHDLQLYFLSFEVLEMEPRPHIC